MICAIVVCEGFPARNILLACKLLAAISFWTSRGQVETTSCDTSVFDAGLFHRCGRPRLVMKLICMALYMITETAEAAACWSARSLGQYFVLLRGAEWMHSVERPLRVALSQLRVASAVHERNHHQYRQ